MKKLALPLALAAAALATGGCSKEKTCAADETLCGDSCTSLQSDSAHCGACGTSCGAGQACLAGACVACGSTSCQAEVVAACFNGNEVRAFGSDLAQVGSPVPTTASGPASFAYLGGALYVADGSGRRRRPDLPRGRPPRWPR